MKTNKKFRGGSITIFSTDRSKIVGELTDAEWIEEIVDTGVNNVFQGIASEGTLDTVLSMIQTGVATVAYDFFADADVYQGTAFLLRPVAAKPPASAIISIETPDAPKVAGPTGITGATALYLLSGTQMRLLSVGFTIQRPPWKRAAAWAVASITGNPRTSI